MCTGESRFSAIARELLAIVCMVKHFRPKNNSLRTEDPGRRLANDVSNLYDYEKMTKPDKINSLQ